MLNFALCTDAERREAAAVERRRTQEEERKKRIFGPKAKIFIDQDALTKQIEEKRTLQAEERVRDALFEESSRQYALLAKEIEEQEKLERKKQMKEINEFRLKFQKKEDRREADVNNSYTVAARKFDDDPRCGVSSMQIFNGEDLFEKDRRKIQAEQTKAWLDQQMDEKERADRERRDAAEAYRQATYARDLQARELQKLENECRHRLSMAYMDFNKAMADEQERVKQTLKREEEQDVLAHKYNVMMSDMMLESPDAASGVKGKGLSRTERMTLLEEQKQLAKEVRERKEWEKRRNKEFDEYAYGVSQTVAAMDADLIRKKQELSRSIAEENLRMSKEQRKQQEFLKKVVYTNCPSPEFYDQFNKTAR